MALTQEEEERLQEYLDIIGDHPDSLTEWENQFMTDMRARFEKYGAGMFMSPKQWAIFTRVIGKINGEGR